MDDSPSPASPRRTTSSRERIAKRRAAKRGVRYAAFQGRFHLWIIAAAAVLSIVALVPVIIQIYAQNASARAGSTFARAATPPVATPIPARATAVGPTAVPGSVKRIPILMYHHIRDADQAGSLESGLSVPPDAFAQHLDVLARAGYTTLRMDEALACLRGATGCPTRPVALTFDDGYQNAYTAALPLLQQRGFVATFYIVSDFVGQPGYLTWEQLKALHAAGMEIGAHTVSHADLTTIDADAARYEIAESKKRIGALVGTEVTSFCYPAGRNTPATRALVREAGFASAVTTDPAASFDDPLGLPRLRVDGTLDGAGFEALLRAFGTENAGRRSAN